MNTTKIGGMVSRLPAPLSLLGIVAGLSLMLTTGCGEKTDEGTGAANSVPPAPAASVAAGGAPVPGNPNPNAAANAAAFEAARKKAEGK